MAYVDPAEDNPKPRLALSKLITEPAITIHNKASSGSRLGKEEKRDGMDPAENRDIVVYKLYKRRWLGLGEHTSKPHRTMANANVIYSGNGTSVDFPMKGIMNPVLQVVLNIISAMNW
jgi:hypothetical protein